MHLIDVIPIARGITKETLSYFCAQDAEVGTIVFVPIRNRTIPALTIKREKIKDVKTRVKTSDFAIRKTLSQKAVPFLPPEFIQAARKMALYSATTTGAVLYATIPQPILLSLEEGNFSSEIQTKTTHKKSGGRGRKKIFQAELPERLAHYRVITRESFSKKRSVVIVSPTISDAEYIAKELARGIDEHVFCLHGSLSKKELRARFKAAQESTHPVLIVGTPPFLSLFREDIKTIILEREHARAYKMSRRPYLDMRVFAEYYAQERNIKLILSDLPLRLETLWRYKNEELEEVAPPKLRVLSSAESRIIDMREESKLQGKTFEVLGDMLKKTLRDSALLGERYFLLSTRRGIAPMTLCKDCGVIVTSRDGTTPMVLHKRAGENVFISHKTGELRSANERCKNCKSWRLEAIGIGIERVHDAVEDLGLKIPIFHVDRDTTKTHTQIKKEVKKFYDTPGSVLVGTELVLPYLTEPIEHSAIVSADTLLSLPEWRITERIFSSILSVRGIATKSFILQTRKAKEEILRQALTGNIESFYKSEIKLRKDFSYPPFSILVKISIKGALSRVESEMEKVEALFKDFNIHVYPASLEIGGNQQAKYALMRVMRDEWPDEAITQRLRTLPPYFAVDIDPENLL